jgi:O-antigen/teichoic acid export membrane protein
MKMRASTDPELGAALDLAVEASGPHKPRSAGTDLLSSAAVVFVGNVVSRGLGFLFPLVLARVCLKSDFALVYFFVNTGFVVSELVLAGFPTAMTQYVSADPASRGRWASASVAGGLPLLAVSIAVGFTMAIQADVPPLFMSVVVIGLTIDAYYFALLRGLGWFGTLMLYRIAANVGQLVVLLAAAALGMASVGLAVAAYSLLYLAPIAVIEWRRGPIRLVFANRVRIARRDVIAIARFAVPALVSGVAYSAIQGLDVYFVRMFAAAQQADYSAARALAMPIQMIPFAVTVILLPRVASASAHDRVRLLRSSVLLTAVALVAISLCYVPFAGLLVGLIFPPSYHRGAELLVLIVPAFGLVGFYSVLSQWWMGTGRVLVPAACIVVAAAVAAASEIILTSRFGAIGAPISISIGALVAITLLGSFTVFDLAHPRSKGGRDHGVPDPSGAAERLVMPSD